MKWAVIGQGILRIRFETLAKLLSEQHIENQLEVVECTEEEFPAKLQSLQNRVDQIRIEAPFGRKAVELFKSQTMMVAALGAADCVLRRADGWWLNACFFYGLNKAFSRHGALLDLKGEVLLVGTGAAARLALAAAVRAGFENIMVTSKFEKDGLDFVKETSRRFFGLSIRFVPQDQLVLLPGKCSLLMNASPLVSSNDLLSELYYLNFLRPDGMIWDFVMMPATTPVIREGEQINIRCVRGRELAALSDLQWLEWTLPNRDLSSLDLEAEYAKVFPDPLNKPTGPDPQKSRTLA